MGRANRLTVTADYTNQRMLVRYKVDWDTDDDLDTMDMWYGSIVIEKGIYVLQLGFDSYEMDDVDVSSDDWVTWKPRDGSG